MGIGYILVNHSQKECIRFAHIPASKARELAGNPVSAAITTWYLLQHRGEAIAFISDSEDEWPFPAGNRSDLNSYTEVTERLVAELVEAGILRDEGKAWADKDEPDTVYERALINIWME